MIDSIGRNIQFYRKQRGLTQDQLANAVGISTQSIRQIENGLNLTSLENFIAICKTLDVPTDFIVADMDKKFKIAATIEMIDRLSEFDDAEFETISNVVQMIYLHKTKKKNSIE